MFDDFAQLYANISVLSKLKAGSSVSCILNAFSTFKIFSNYNEFNQDMTPW